jgi:hypothetical protein
LWYEIVAPARLVSSITGDNLALGFIVVNLATVTFSLWCSRACWRHCVSFWAVLELGNDVSHSVLALSLEGYFPGLRQLRSAADTYCCAPGDPSSSSKQPLAGVPIGTIVYAFVARTGEGPTSFARTGSLSHRRIVEKRRGSP